MSIEAIQSLGSLDLGALKTDKSTASTGASFANWLQDEVVHTDQQIKQAEKASQSLALGDADNLHQVMIALDKAQLSFDLVAQIRNRLVEGVQEVMRMSV